VNWEGPVTLDPCDPDGPFDAGFCKSDESTKPDLTFLPNSSDSKLVCRSGMPRTGTDRPELLASRFDDSVFMAVGVFGETKGNLVLLRSKESDLTSWKAMDTGLPSGAACSMTETKTHLYFSRCEFGPNPFNVGLYAYRKDQPFEAKSVVFLGNIADASCASGDVNISLMKTPAGVPVVRWVYPLIGGGRQFFRTGFSAITPGGLVKLQSSDKPSEGAIRLPTLVEGDSNRALLYWYELGTDNKWRVQGSVSDGIAKWSPTFSLSGGSWAMTGLPWDGVFVPGNDYMKGQHIKLGASSKYVVQWIQPRTTAGKTANEIFYGIVDW
jgi:hypothetical protein